MPFSPVLLPYRHASRLQMCLGTKPSGASRFDLTLRNAILLATVGIGLLSEPAAAQQSTVSPVTVAPPTLVPDQRDETISVDIPELGALRPPVGSEDLFVQLRDVTVDGAFPDLAREVETIAASLRGERVSLAEIYSAASEIEAVHARAGYVLARVSVPPQQLADGGTLRLVVTDGFIETVDTSALPQRIREGAAARLASLEGRGQVTLADMEEALSLASDLPGVTLRSTIMQGSRPGGTRLVLEGEQKLLTGRLSVDNQLDPSLGDWGGSLQLALNSALGLGEQIYVFTASDFAMSDFFGDTPREQVVGGGVIMPLVSGRFTINPEATFATTTPDVVPGVLPTQGKLERLSLRGQAVISKSRRKDLRIGLALERMNVWNEALGFGVRLSQDRYSAARLSASYSGVYPSGMATGLSLQLSKGLDILGAISASDAARSDVPLSRIGSDTDFVTLGLDASAAIPIGRDFRFSLVASGQTSFGDPLFRSEQFTLEGPDGLSAFIGGVTAVDSGAVVRAEFSAVHSVADGRVTLAPYVFAAGGAGELSRPTAVEEKSISAANFGTGIRARLFGLVDLRLEYACSTSRIDELDLVERVNFSTAIRF